MWQCDRSWCPFPLCVIVSIYFNPVYEKYPKFSSYCFIYYANNILKILTWEKLFCTYSLICCFKFSIIFIDSDSLLLVFPFLPAKPIYFFLYYIPEGYELCQLLHVKDIFILSAFLKDFFFQIQKYRLAWYFHHFKDVPLSSCCIITLGLYFLLSNVTNTITIISNEEFGVLILAPLHILYMHLCFLTSLNIFV